MFGRWYAIECNKQYKKAENNSEFKAVHNNSDARQDDFWKIQCYLAREYIENKRFNDAYIVASVHFAESSANISDAEFLSGWLALRFLNKPQLAIKHFKKFAQVVKTPISISRGMYWLGRAYAKNGQQEEARKLYERAAHQFGYTFYGQVATLEIGANKLRLPPKVTSTHKKDYNIKNRYQSLIPSERVDRKKGLDITYRHVRKNTQVDKSYSHG